MNTLWTSMSGHLPAAGAKLRARALLAGVRRFGSRSDLGRLGSRALPGAALVAGAFLPSLISGLIAHREAARPAPRAEARLASAILAAAIGALALGAVSIGALAVARVAVKSMRISRLQIDELDIRRSNGAIAPS